MGKTIVLRCFYKNVNKLPKKKKMSKYITDDTEISSDDSDK